MLHDAADARDLLFALQGLQTGLIDRDDVVHAIRQRQGDQTRSLRETLLAHSAISADACSAIDSVVAHQVRE